jgi:cell fate (sporulation/competence/biofilm development) regulator YlbF (YheA/YmcA/DUF963 family)
MREKNDRLTGAPTDGTAMNCEEFQEQLPQLMEAGIHDHPHLRSCQRCTALLEELESIAHFAAELLKPVYEPHDKVWNKIQTQIAHEDGISRLDRSSTGHPRR